MANYNINCPHCGGILEARDDWAGLQVTCPLCRQAFNIPPQQTAGQMPSPPPPPPVQSQPTDRNAAAAYRGEQITIQCPHCGANLAVQAEWANMETTCPSCNNSFVIPGRPTVNRGLNLPPQTRPSAAGNVEAGPQTPPYYGPQTPPYYGTSAVNSPWQGQTAAPPVNPFLRPFVNCLTTKGRASRLEFNLFIFITWPVLCFLFFILFIGISSIANAESKAQETVFSIIFLIYAFFWTFPISVRRFHDFGYNGLHYLFQFIPILNIVYILYGLYLIFRPSDPGENAFGPQP